MSIRSFKYVLRRAIYEGPEPVNPNDELTEVSSDEFIGSFSIKSEYSNNFGIIASGESVFTKSKGTFELKIHSPDVFRKLRVSFGFDEETYRNSFDELPDDSDIADEFFLTKNKLFFVKSINEKEANLFRETFFPQYYEYWRKHGSESLLPQFCGMYYVTIDKKIKYYLVFRSIFGNKKEIDRKYELKGALIQRHASEEEKKKESPLYKDEDFVNEKEKICIGSEEAERFMNILKRDVQFLIDAELMDYSILVGIHNRKNETLDTTSSTETNEKENQIGNEKYAIQTDDVIYYMGLFDVLTYYDAMKKTEHAFKSMMHGFNSEISTVSPEKYGQRLLQFIEKAISSS